MPRHRSRPLTEAHLARAACGSGSLWARRLHGVATDRTRGASLQAMPSRWIVAGGQGR